jgi:poly-gamma-glutamate capsule biosynthesis protein CapA/YwtB (metallophosphatase superfamily)
MVETLSLEAANRVTDEVQRFKQAGDIALVSIHWGGNWGYEVPRAQTLFAHRLIDAGVDLIHGHSSHHAKAIEVYKDRLIRLWRFCDGL